MTGFRLPAALLAAALVACMATAAPARTEEGPLRVCLDENVPLLSAKRGKEAHGFDLAVARAVGRRLGREVEIQWFESELDDDSDPVREANALLSDGRCRLIGGYPLFATALGEPSSARSRLPDYDGAQAKDRRRSVQLNTLVGSRGYRFAPLVVALGPKAADRRIGRLGDLKDLRLVVEEGTLADAILMAYEGGALVDRITHVAPAEGMFESLEQGEYDATLVELHRLDAHRAKHPDTKLASSGHYHSVGFNVGFVGLAQDEALIAGVNDAIGDMLAGDELQALAAQAGLTYLPPRSPDVLGPLTRTQLRGD